MDTLESLIADWHLSVALSPESTSDRVDELEAQLRTQITELRDVGLTDDEAFLVAIRRLARTNAASLEFAREALPRLGVTLTRGQPAARSDDGLTDVMSFALLAAVAAQVVRIVANFPEQAPMWLARNIGFAVLPFLVAFIGRRQRLALRQWLTAAALVAALALVTNAYPWTPTGSTQILAAIHVPVLLWFIVAYAHAAGDLQSHQARMAFVRFTGEWLIYLTLIAIGGGVLLVLTAGVLAPVSSGLADQVIVWVLPSGAAGGVIVAAWLAQDRTRMAGSLAPVLTRIFTPLFGVMLTTAAVMYVATGVAFDREMLVVFDALLVVVLALVLYGTSTTGALATRWMVMIQLVTVTAALTLDVMVLVAMTARIDLMGFTPNRVAALGLNLVLLVNLAGSAWTNLRHLSGRAGPQHLARWQSNYLPVFAGWAGVVVVVLPPLFSFA